MRNSFQPNSVHELAQAVTLCAGARCPFGVKSGGHGHFAGESCLDRGIQFDLFNINNIYIDKSKGSVLVGTGNNWGTVYTKLQKEGLIAVGGRSVDVEVGAFLIGGGISLYAVLHGWAINNVRSFEVVFSNGQVVTANKDSILGRGSNLGIITTFELKTYPYSGMWGGRRTIESMHAKQAIFAYTGFLQQLQTDPKGHTIIIFTYDEGPFQLMQYLVYTYPVADLPSFDDLRNVPAVQSSLRLTDYTDLATNILHLGQGNGDCASVATLTLKPDAELFNFAFKTFVEEASSISEYIKGTMELHALCRSQKLTDNLFGLEDGQGPLVSFLLIFSTELERYDAQVIATQQRIIEKVKQEVEERDLYHPFIFANHAGEWQNVIGSFGDRNVRLLSEMASVYDPEQVFQHLQSGSFRVKAAGERLTA